MAERYEKLFSSYEKFYSQGSPALIVAKAILKDNRDNKVKAQLKFQNIYNKSIKAVNISIKAYDSFGRELQGIDEYQYTDLCVYQGSYWGQDKAITLPSDLTRTIKVSIHSVIYQDDTIWVCESNIWNKLSETKKMYSILLDDELVKQYKLEYGEFAEYVCFEEEGVWHCTCGAINQLNAQRCYSCKIDKDSILDCDLGVLKSNADARVAREKKEAEERARIKAEEEEKRRIAEKARVEQEKVQKRKRTIKLIIIALAIILIALIPTEIMPAIAYNRASKLLDNGNYDDAYIAFQALGDYRDSAEQVLETMYQKAVYHLNNDQFDDAINIFNSIVNYKDVDEKALEAKYQKAEFLFSEKKYEKAINIWTILGDYSNSKERILMTIEVQTEEEYQKALSLMNEQKYDEAIEHFRRLNDYKDSTEKIIECFELKKEVDY